MPSEKKLEENYLNKTAPTLKLHDSCLLLWCMFFIHCYCIKDAQSMYMFLLILHFKYNADCTTVTVSRMKSWGHY